MDIAKRKEFASRGFFPQKSIPKLKMDAVRKLVKLRFVKKRYLFTINIGTITVVGYIHKVF